MTQREESLEQTQARQQAEIDRLALHDDAELWTAMNEMRHIVADAKTANDKGIKANRKFLTQYCDDMFNRATGDRKTTEELLTKRMEDFAATAATRRKNLEDSLTEAQSELAQSARDRLNRLDKRIDNLSDQVDENAPHS